MLSALSAFEKKNPFAFVLQDKTSFINPALIKFLLRVVQPCRSQTSREKQVWRSQRARALCKPFIKNQNKMISWIKKLFAKPAASQTSFTLQQAQRWLIEKQALKEKELRTQIINYSNKIKNHANSTKQAINELKNARLKNPNVPERELNLMRGNREQYCKQAEQFLNTLPKPEDYQDVQDYFVKTEHALEELAKKTARPYAVLQEFFANETRAVHASIGQIVQEIRSFKKNVQETKFDRVKKARQTAEEITVKQSRRARIQAEINHAEQELKNIRKTLLGLHKEKARIQSSPALLKTQENVALAKRAVKEQEEKIRELLSPLEGALKRFLRVATRHKKLIQAYIDNPVQALTQDLRLEIIDVFKDLERVLEFNRLELKDKLKEKTESIISKTNKQALGALQRELGVRMKTFKDLKNELAELEATKTLERVKKLITEQSAKEKRLSEHAEKLSKDLARIDVEELRQELEKELGEINNARVSLTL